MTLPLPSPPALCCALTLLLAGCGQPAQETTELSASDTAELADLRERLSNLQARKTRIEDIKALKRLHYAYAYYMSEGQWDDAADLFADNGILEFGRDGVYAGKTRVREWLHAYGGGEGQNGLREGQLNDFIQIMPAVTLGDDGQTAKARWRSIMLLGQHGENALWGEGPYENEYVKEDGVWKISRLRWYQTIVVPYEDGWITNADYNQGIWVSDTLPPDAPQSDNFGSWPETFLPPFSFPNPVARYVPPSAAAATEDAR